MANLLNEVERFRKWADGIPHSERSGEWECNYEPWPALHEAVLEFVDRSPFESWSDAELQAVLYSIARDNEFQYLAGGNP